HRPGFPGPHHPAPPRARGRLRPPRHSLWGRRHRDHYSNRRLRSTTTMYLTRHATPDGPRWAVDGQFLPLAFSLRLLLALPAAALGTLASLSTGEPASGDQLGAR